MGTEGPGGQYFYQQAMFLGHAYLFSGGLLNLPGTGNILVGAADANGANSWGARYLDITDGTVGHTVTAGNSKTAVMGDFESVCDPNPIEVGNLVWKDVNGNGFQDGDEPALVGVTVGLYNSANTLISSAVTDANGNYIFSSATKTSTASLKYGLNLTNGLNYKLKITALGSNPSVSGLSLTDVSLAPGETSGQPNSRTTLANNDAFLVSGNPTISFELGNPGENNHNYDFGLIGAPACTPPNAGANLSATVGGSATLTGTNPTTGTWTALSSNPAGATLLGTTSGGVATASFTVEGTYSFIYANGTCQDTMNVTVTCAKPNAGSDKLVCFNTGTESAYMTAEGTGTWAALPDNAGTSTITLPAWPYTIITNFSAVGVYRYTWTSASCSDTVIVTVSGGLSGMAFRDYNSDGIMDANETQGVENIKVRLYDHSGSLIDSTYTNANGQYAFPTLTAAAGQVKIEFVKSTYPSFMQESFNGTNNGTDVQFVTHQVVLLI